MTATGHLLRILGVAIVLIAAQVMPLPAHAHGGHAHGSTAAAAHHHHDHRPAASLPSQAIAPAMAIVTAGEWRAAPRDLQNDVVTCSGCVAGCCGNGTGCCGAALAAAPPANLPPVARALGRAPETAIPGRGAEPDGLRRPPRPFA